MVALVRVKIEPWEWYDGKRVKKQHQRGTSTHSFRKMARYWNAIAISSTPVVCWTVGWFIALQLSHGFCICWHCPTIITQYNIRDTLPQRIVYVATLSLLTPSSFSPLFRGSFYYILPFPIFQFFRFFFVTTFHAYFFMYCIHLIHLAYVPNSRASVNTYLNEIYFPYSSVLQKPFCDEKHMLS